MRVPVLIALTICTFTFTAPQNLTPTPSRTGKAQQRNSQTASDQRGTDQSPLIVKTLPATKTQAETEQDVTDRKEKTANDRHIVELTGVLAVIAFLQLLVYTYQAKKLRETVESAIEQSEAMERSIEAAGRSAAAMEKVAAHIEISSKAAVDSVVALRERTAQQMRAYLTVVVGAVSLYQDRLENIKFEGKALLVNGGHTPARKVSYRAKAEILPIPLPDNFEFALPNKEIGGAMVGAGQNATISAMLEKFVQDIGVEDIKRGANRSLYLYGSISYEDIFGAKHTTKFCQSIVWLPNGTPFGYYVPGYNDAD
jgi:hypothetical protein